MEDDKKNIAYSVDTPEILSYLETDENGLSQKEAAYRLKKYGKNMLREEKQNGPLQILLDQFKSFLIIILIIAALVSGLLLKETVDMIVILFIVILNAVIGFVQEYRAEKAVQALQSMISPQAVVIRENKTVKIPAENLVPGDVINISDGDRVPVDARIITESNLAVDESPLTGESSPVYKSNQLLQHNTPLYNRTNMVYMGTHVTRGRGKAVVTLTGMNTEFGRIADMLQSVQEEDPPLKIKTELMGKQLGLIALFGCVLVFVIDYLNGIGFITSFMSAVSLAVSAIPEGLPAVMIVTLSLGAQKMAKRNAIIRKLSSVETLGTTTVICSDKTGTITKNEMTLSRVFVDNALIEVTGEGYSPVGKFLFDNQDLSLGTNRTLDLALRIGLLCNDAVLENDDKLGHYLIGDPTEGALMVGAIKAGYNPVDVHARYPRVWEAPFSSERKMMSTVNVSYSGYVAYVKGAPEVLLSRSDKIIYEDAVTPLNDAMRESLEIVIKEMANNAFRVLAVAYKPAIRKDIQYTEFEIEKDLVFVGLLALRDPPRSEVKAAIKTCKKAGIKTIMITGDHKDTAIAIAKEVGIMGLGDKVFTGDELERMTDQDLREIVNHSSVFARVSPEHKVRIANALQDIGHIVAMTGDGVNDAPAIKTADIGIAMGIKGTDVTKEAADMVLSDDNFATIVSAVEEGRIIYDNIRKFMRFMISSNFDEMLVISSFVLLGYPMPLLPVMILWLNLVTDGGPAIALSMDTPVDDLMNIPPRDPKQGLLHGMMPFIVVYVVLQSGTTAATFIWKYLVQGASLEVARTVTFMQACIFELFVVWNCRSETHNAFKVGFTSNKYLLGSVIVGLVLTVSLCYVPVFQTMFQTVPLSSNDWIWVFGSGLLGLLVFPEMLFKKRENLMS